MRFTYQTGAQPLSGYTIHRGIHRGGFGEVYFAHSDGGKEVALKLLHDQDHETEVRGVTQCLNLKHPNLVNIFDLKTDAHGDHWVVMEYVSGSSLEDVLASFPHGLPPGEVRDWLSGLVAGVSHLHDRGIVHRDLKPANVYRENGVVKVGDVGLSKRLDSDHRRQHTQSVGTVYYMAPEVAKGKYGPEVDVYSLGVMLYEMISGKLPFTGETTAEILMKHLTAQPDLTPIPKSLRPVVARALEKDPQKRTPTARQLEQDFLRASGVESESKTNHEPSSKTPDVAPGINGHAKVEKSPWISVTVNRPLPRPFATSAGRLAAFQTGSRIVFRGLKVIALLVLALLTSVAAVFSSGVSWVVLIAVVLPFLILRDLYLLACDLTGKLHEDFSLKDLSMKGGQRLFQTVTDAFLSNGKRRSSTVDVVVPPIPSWNKQPANEFGATSSAVGTQQNAAGNDRAVASISRYERIAELGSSIGLSGLIASILSAGVCLILSDIHNPSMMPTAEHAVLFVAISVVGSWLLLISHKLTLHSSLTKHQKWLVRIATGALLGTCAFGLNEFLKVHTPTMAYSARALVSSILFRPLTLAGADPTWLGYVVFFASFLGIRRWSREMDPCRKKMFSIPLTAASVAMAFLVSLVFAFPQWYAMFWAGTISATLQLASAWTPKSGERGEQCQ